MEQDRKSVISSKICSKCGGEAEGWKCAQCGQTGDRFDPFHQCGGGKFQPKCKKCGQAEDNCTCVN